MKVEIGFQNVLVLKEIYGDTVLEIQNGKRLAICMRDDTIEMSVPGSDKWFRVNMKNGDIELLGTGNIENGVLEELTAKHHK